MHTSEIFVGGQWRPPVLGETYATINPATEEVSPDRQGGRAGRRPRGPLRAQGLRRGRVVGKPAAERPRDPLEDRRADRAHLAELARLETLDTGKPISTPTTSTCRRRRHLPLLRGLGDEDPRRDGPGRAAPSPTRCASRSASSARSCPGTSRSSSPRGRSRPRSPPATRVVLKPAEPDAAHRAQLARDPPEAGLPAGVFNVVRAAATAGTALVRHPGVDKIAFTGSTEVGKGIMREAAGR